ncbi:MAG: RHS repeat-associated core domain-containing protein [Saprospiraceae bacterium]|nr:RHS repeat-associated core domain-containing protein [Saprospiraceae bacterium]
MNFRANGTAVTFLEEMHYYPFGMQMEGMGTQNPANKYLYNGKELNDDLGLNWSDYGARWYDAALGRWWSVDPLAEEYWSCSPYNYGINNAIRFTDPDGKSIVVPLGKNRNGGVNTEAYQKTIINSIQKLTNDKLAWGKDKSGNTIIVIGEKDAHNSNKDLTFGTGLVRLLVNSGDKNIFIGAPKDSEKQGNLTYTVNTKVMLI